MPYRLRETTAMDKSKKISLKLKILLSISSLSDFFASIHVLPDNSDFSPWLWEYCHSNQFSKGLSVI